MKEEMFSGIIYKYTSPSGKVYIGQTRDERKRRSKWFSTGTYYAGSKLENARKKYGPENFEYEVLMRIQSDNEDDLVKTLNMKESEYIKLYDSFKRGYNSDLGGSQNIHSAKQISKSHEKAIIQYTLDGDFVQVWKSSKEVEKVTGIKACNIALVLKGTRYQTGGFIFRYYTGDDFPLKIEVQPSKAQKQVVCQYTLGGDLIREFPCINDAASVCCLNRNQFKLYLDGKNNHIYNNYIWRRKYE